MRRGQDWLDVGLNRPEIWWVGLSEGTDWGRKITLILNLKSLLRGPMVGIAAFD
jgi:hypothetical protein